MTVPFEYNIAARLSDGSEVILDPETKGWAEPERLAKVVNWSIVPRNQNGLPTISVQIPEGAKPIFKTRVYGKGYPGIDNGLPVFRCYAVGWHDTESHWLWVLPTGDIEVGEDPQLAPLILQKMAGLI